MRALLPALLLVTLAVRGACITPAEIAAGPRSIQARCSYWKADVAASGSYAVAAWMRSTTVGMFPPTTIGATEGGVLDARGRLVPAAQLPLNDAPGYPSMATNGQLSLLAWSRTSQGTFAQFLGADGARMGEAVKVSQSGMNFVPPRAVWNGAEWKVVFHEGTDVVSVRVEPDGTLADRKVVAANATLAAARGDSIVVSTAVGFQLITPTATHPLPAIPAGAAVAIGERFLAWHAGAIGVQPLPAGNPIAIAGASSDAKNIATAGDVVLWNDGSTVRGARVSDDGGTRAIAPVDGRLHAAAATAEGVVALISGTCSSVTSRYLPQGGTAFAEPEVVSRAMAAQRPHAIVPTPRGHHVFWSEDRPDEDGARLFVTQIEGFLARPPVALGGTISQYGPVVAAPHGDGSVVAWVELTNGQLPVTVKYARVDAEGRLRGAPVQIGEAHYVLDLAVAARGGEIVVFTNLHETSAWINDLWQTTIDAAGGVTRVQLAADHDGFRLDAAATADGIAASWDDYAGNDTLRLTVREPGATHTFPLPWPLSHELFGGTSPLVLWHGRGEVHALFPRSSVDVVAVPAGGTGAELMNAVEQSDGSFHVAVAPYDAAATNVIIVNVTRAGVVTPREGICFGAPAWLMSMRGATVDAIVGRDASGGVFVGKRPGPRRRAIR